MPTTVTEGNSQHLPQDGDTSEFDNSLRELAPRELYRLSRALSKQLHTTIAPEFVTLLRAAIVMNLFNGRPLTPKALAGAVVEFGLEANILIEFAAAHDKCFAKEYQALSKSKGNLESIHWAALFLLNAAAKAEIGLSLLLDFEAMVDRLLNRTGEERPASLVRLLHGLALNPLALPEALLPQPSSVVALVKSFPNFGEVAQFYAGQIALRSIAGHSALCLPPVLLVGSPGIGKTHFTAELAQAIGLDHHMIPMNSQSGGFVLSGLDSGWSTGKPGRVFTCLAGSSSRSPLIVLDEIDKITGDAHHDPLGPLYGLLEPGTARKFVDEFLGTPMDASGIVWIATANDLSEVPEAIRSRFLVFEIEPPDAAQLGEIADRMLAELTGNRHGRKAAMSDEARLKLAKGSVRDLKLALQQGLGRAALRSEGADFAELRLTAGDLAPFARPERRPIGFMAS